MAVNEHDTDLLTQEVATVPRDHTFPVANGVWVNPDRTLAARGGAQGLGLYDLIFEDLHAGAVLTKFRRAVTSREWYLEPASESPEDVAVAAEIKAMLLQLDLDGLTDELLDAVVYGFTVVEILWQVGPKRIEVQELLARDSRRFVFGEDRELRLLTTTDVLRGMALPSHKFIVHRWRRHKGNPYGANLGAALYWACWFKKKGIAFWLQFADKFGSPTVVATYRRNASEEDKAALFKAALGVARDAAVLIPEGTTLTLLEASRSGSIDTYEKLVRFMDEQMSVAVLGETLSTNLQGAGSRAASETHNDVRIEGAKQVADAVCGTLNRTLIRWLCDLNWPDRIAPQLWRRFPELDLPALAIQEREHKLRQDAMERQSKIDTALSELGWIPTPEHVRQTYGNGYVLLSPPAAVTAFAEGEDPISPVLERAEDVSATLLTSWRKTIQKQLSAANSFGDLSAMLENPELTDAQPVIEQALLTARLSGMSEVMDG